MVIAQAITPLNGSFYGVTTRIRKSGKAEVIPVVPLTRETISQFPHGDVAKTLSAVVKISHPSNRGSGFVISSDGGVLTVNHILDEKTDHVEVSFLSSDKVLPGKVLFRSPGKDLALIVLDGDKDTDYQRANFASENPKIDDKVYTMGINGITAGQVLARDRIRLNERLKRLLKLTSDDLEGAGGLSVLDDFIVSTNTVNPGDSGSMLCNESAQVIGLSNYVMPLPHTENWIISKAILRLMEFSHRMKGRRISVPKIPIKRILTSTGLSNISKFLSEIGTKLDDLARGKAIRGLSQNTIEVR